MATMKKDPVWRYGKRLSHNKFKCSFCKDTFLGSAKRLKLHLAQVTGWHIRRCPDVPADVSEKCLNWLMGASSSSFPARETEKSPQEMIETGEGSGSETEQEEIGSVRMSVCRFLQKTGLPLEVVEDPVFVDLFCTITHFGHTGVPAVKELHDVADFVEVDGDDWK